MGWLGFAQPFHERADLPLKNRGLPHFSSVLRQNFTASRHITAVIIWLVTN
jgi:hypothetical protein